MTQGLQRESAVIIPFAPRARLADNRARRVPAQSPLPTDVAIVPTGGCWYHDAAIREDLRGDDGRKG